jgi:para-aminobenzoate synthetase component I
LIDLSEIAGGRCAPHIEKIDIKRPFIDLAAGFAHIPGTVLLMSGGDLDCSRYHILGIKPWLAFKGRGRRMTLISGTTSKELDADPFDTLRTILKSCHMDSPAAPLPLSSGLMGYLAYDLKDHIERLPRTSVDDLGLPGICLFAPSIILIHDKLEHTTWLCVSRCPDFENSMPAPDDFMPFENPSSFIHKPPLTFTQDFKPNMTRREYYSSIKKIREYISSGDVYQVNFAQRFEASFSGDPFELFRSYYIENPAPFFAFINAGDHQIISTSPERFIHRDGNKIETRPIKGTRPRGKDEKADLAFRRELEESEKDESELSMIVDLMRNDLGKVCEGGSVCVLHHKKMEQYENVHHMVSVVGGRLDRRYDSVDLIKATFPGGSITGCPKIRAMEIIDELEPNRRHVYTGSIGYLSFHDTMDLSIAIRTATVYDRKMFVSFGGGIVYDSEPSKEYDETMRKGKTLLHVKKRKNRSTQSEQVWINGALKPLDQAHIKVSDPGFQYGYGFFETIRFDGRAPCFLEEHMARFNLAWRDLFRTEAPDLSWDEIIHQVIDANKLKDIIAAVKIIASRGTRNAPPYDHTLIVTARPYTPRLSGEVKDGLNLITYPYPRQTPLADYKSLNYSYYYLAGRWAREHGADEALILNPDQTISETNTANIIVIKGRSVFSPASPHVLSGIMEEKVLHVLSLWGYTPEKKYMTTDDLLIADNVLMTNSLIGAAPVKNIDDNGLKDSKDICKNLNNVIMLPLTSMKGMT